MSTAVTAYTLADLKTAVAGIMSDLAAMVEPDTYECRDCLRAATSMCGDHGAAAARQRLLEDAAADVAAAQDRDEIEAIIIRAYGGK